MTAITFAALPQRGLLGLGGPDALAFLQDLISNDVERLSSSRSLYALLLTPQGKFLHDFFVAGMPDAALPGAGMGAPILLDCERERIADLERRLTLYRLRSDVTVADLSDVYAVAAAFGDGALAALGLQAEAGNTVPFGGGIAMVDPRLGDLGARVILPAAELPGALSEAGFEEADAAAYDRMRLSHGVPDASRDMAVEQTFPLEAGMDQLNAIDYAKGCYVGQELTARTHYRGTIRKRLFRVDIDGPVPAPGAAIQLGDRKAGVMRSGQDGIGMAMLRMELVDESRKNEKPFTAGDARLRAVAQPWFREDQAADAGVAEGGAV